MISLVKVPELSSPHVKNFCRSISTQSPPILTEIQYVEDALPLYCFQNVKNYTQYKGGFIQFGYSIWEYPKLFIEAEHHAVWISLDGEFVDITPSNDGDKFRLFLPDNSAIYDFDQPKVRRDNIRKALIKDTDIDRYLKLWTVKNQVMNNFPGIGDVSIPVDVHEKLSLLDKEMEKLLMRSHLRHYGPNDLCFCGSGKKQKKCHGMGTFNKLKSKILV